MRVFDAAMQTHLEQQATTLCHCWQVTRRDGVVLGFSDHDRPLVIDDVTYEPNSGFDGAAVEQSADLAVDNAEVEGAFASDKITQQDLLAGLYDGAEVICLRVNWSSPGEYYELARATIGEVSIQNGQYRAELRGPAHLLDQSAGRTYQRGCDARLGDERCGVDLDAPGMRSQGTVTAIVDEGRFLASGLGSHPAGDLQHGALVWTSGGNQSQTGHIKRHGEGASSTASIELWLPTPVPVAVGDQFTASRGCDKRFQTCLNKFSNHHNFRGFHLMPGNDFAISYPLRGDNNDGGKRS